MGGVLSSSITIPPMGKLCAPPEVVPGGGGGANVLLKLVAAVLSPPVAGSENAVWADDGLNTHDAAVVAGLAAPFPFIACPSCALLGSGIMIDIGTGPCCCCCP